ncbi:MAG: helix-turn-helix domain-containing protein, partial [Nitrospinota bacterium]
ELLIKAMTKADGILGRAAQLLGMSYRTLQYRLNKFGIRKESFTALKGITYTPKGLSERDL